MLVLNILGRFLIAFLMAAPWLWIAAFALAIVAAYMFDPYSYGTPNPGDVSGLEWLLTTMFLLVPVCILSPFVLSATSAIRQVMRFAPLMPGPILLNLLGVASMVTMLYGNFAGVADWLID